MEIYETLVDAESSAPDRLPALVAGLVDSDETGQYLCSGARYLGALDRGRYAREHRYISQLLPALWGDDFMARAEQLRISDNNFRRIYKRIYPDH